MNKTILRFLISVIYIFICLSSSLADKRSYVWTYEYLTMHKSEAEIEYYFTQSAKDIQDLKTTTNEHQVEIEYGIKDRLDFALYQTFKQSPGGSLKYEKFKTRFRLRLGKKKLYPLS